MIEFVWPATTGELMAFLTAAGLIVVGLLLLIVPRMMMKFLGLAAANLNGVSEVRGPFGGMWLGLGIAAIVLAQPLVYLAMGAALAAAVLGRIVSFFADRTFNIHCIIGTAFEVAGAYFTIAYGLNPLG